MHSFFEIKDDEFLKLMCRIQDFGFDYVSLGLRQPWKNSVFYYFTDHRWENYYIRQGLYENDPLVQACEKTFEAPILWSAVSINSKESAEIMKTRNEIVNVCDGITFSLKGKNFSHILALASSKDRVSLLDTFINHYHEIEINLCLAEKVMETCKEI